MITTSTPNPGIFHGLPPRGAEALPTLRRGGRVLLPTANLWQMVVDARSLQSVRQLLSVCPRSKVNRPELLFADRVALLEWFPRLHPKLETLLSFHGRPLTVMTPANDLVADALVDHRGEVAVRITLDSYCQRLCEDLEAPLAATLAVGNGQTELPTGFGKIRSDVLRSSDYVVKRRQREQLDTQAAVCIRIRRGEVEFL